MMNRPEPEAIITRLVDEAIVDGAPQEIPCLNGPLTGMRVETPGNVGVGRGCALPWKNAEGRERYAVYVVTDFNGTRGLMFLRSYDRPEHAVSKVQQLSIVIQAALA